MRRTAGAVALVTALLAGCSSGATDDARPTAAPLRFASGVAEVDVPLSPREVRPSFGGHWVLVYGGVQYRDGGTAFADGALYDLDAQTWSPVPEAPVDAPLWFPAAVWTGREFVVLGTPCPDPALEEDSVDFVHCDHSPSAAALDPVTRRWRNVRVPDLRSASRGGIAPGITGLGAAGGRAIFTVDAPDVSSATHLVALDADREPVAITVPPASQQWCAIGDRLFAFGDGPRSETPPVPNPTRTMFWDGSSFVALVSAATPARLWQNEVRCGAGSAAYPAVFGTFNGPGRDLWWFDPDSATWSPQANPEPPATLTGFSPMRFMGRRMFQSDVHLYVQVDDGWREHGLWAPAVQPAGRYLVAVPLDAQASPRMTVVDPVQMFPGVFAPA